MCTFIANATQKTNSRQENSIETNGLCIVGLDGGIYNEPHDEELSHGTLHVRSFYGILAQLTDFVP